MTDAAVANGETRGWWRGGDDVATRNDRALTVVLAALLVGTWCSEGVRTAAGLPHAVVGVVDVAEFVIVVWVGLRLVRRRGLRWIPPLVAVYGVWVALGLVTDAPAASVVTALKSLLLLPALALVVAASGSGERRARVVVAVLLALGGLEFVVTLVQSFGTTDSDSIVGTFGPFANAVVGCVVLLVVCVAIAGFLVRAPFGGAGLALGAALPIFSAWTLVKFVPVALPCAALAVVVPAVALRRATFVRGLVAFAVALASSAIVIGSYAVFNRDSFEALFNKRAATNYLQSAAITGAKAVSPEGAIGGDVVSDYANASVGTSGGTSFVISNVAAGDYTAWFGGTGGMYGVRPGKRYVFQVGASSAASVPQKVQAQIEWRDRAGTVLAISEGRLVSLPEATVVPVVATVAATAPARAVTAMPKLAVTGSPPAGSSVTVAAASVAFPQTGHGRGAVPPPSVKPQAPAPRPVPGRLTQWRMAEDAVSRSTARELFGTGLGAATVADGLGVAAQDLSPDAAAASYSDFGTLLVERGWSGVALVAVFGLALLIVALRLARSLPAGLWTTAFTVAVPGAVAVMAAYGMVADQLRNRSAALTFWVIVALGLSQLPHVARGRGDGDRSG